MRKSKPLMSKHTAIDFQKIFWSVMYMYRFMSYEGPEDVRSVLRALYDINPDFRGI